MLTKESRKEHTLKAPYFSSLPRPPGKNSVDIPRLRWMLADSGLFRADKHRLYLYDEERHCWDMIPPGNEVLALRSLFPNDEQLYLVNATVRNLVDWLTEHPMLQFDFEAKRNPFEVNLLNGVFDLSTGLLQPHGESNNYFTSFLDANYILSDASKPCTSAVLDEFCQNVFNPEELAQKLKLLLEFIGFTVSNITDAKKALFMIGPSNCGKSVILAFLMGILGEAAVSTLSLEDFSGRFSKAELYGKTANLSGEIPAGPVSVQAYDVFKGLVGGDLIQVEKKGKDPFSFRFQGTLLFAGNVLPTFKKVDGSEALLNRMVVLVFNKEVPTDKQDRTMVEKLLRERDLIVSRALDAMKDLIASGYQFAMGKDEEKLLRDYREMTYSVKSFLESNCKLDPNGFVYIEDTYQEYVAYANSMALTPVSKHDFRSLMLSDPRIEVASKRRLNGQKPKICFSGISGFHSANDSDGIILYDIKQDTKMSDEEAVS